MKKPVFEAAGPVLEIFEIGEAGPLLKQVLDGALALRDPIRDFPFLTGDGGEEELIEEPDLNDGGRRQFASHCSCQTTLIADSYSWLQ